MTPRLLDAPAGEQVDPCATCYFHGEACGVNFESQIGGCSIWKAKGATGEQVDGTQETEVPA